MKPKWPKKQCLRDFIQSHYTDGSRSRDAIINDIKQGRLPGVKEGRKWFIYVLPDGEPAYGYSEEGKPDASTSSDEAVQLTGNPVADSILARLAANSGIKVSKAS